MICYTVDSVRIALQQNRGLVCEELSLLGCPRYRSCGTPCVITCKQSVRVFYGSRHPVIILNFSFKISGGIGIGFIDVNNGAIDMLIKKRLINPAILVRINRPK